MRKAKLTKNRDSVQMIIPKEFCQKYGFRSGYEILMEDRKDGILIKPSRSDNVCSDFLTIGYEGKEIDGFVERLRENNVSQLIDVRRNPISRKKGFSKSALKERLGKEGIIYRHIPELGSPNEIRDQLRNGGSLSTFLDQYRTYLDTQAEKFDELRGLLLVRHSAVMCFEMDHTGCHRKVLAERLNVLGMKPIHI